ncbi:alpha/beta-hydrolase [Exidia glandulosa HHB12029]|uniref:Alpha/beta-hydrolase n=1 Tax=Exidia glandulosa HHB12029 TaxID=1314781 RepID=A0A166ANT8_EXIGL|nr:alpha/beta-hydrolase [Exidia glandulosa HHB12029]
MSSSRPRTPVSSRLNHLLDSEPSTSRPSTPTHDDDMRQHLAHAAVKLSAARAIAAPEPAILRNSRNASTDTVDSESLPNALRDALADDDAYQHARVHAQAPTPQNLAERRRSQQNFLGMPTLVGSPYLDQLARISLPSVSAATFSTLARTNTTGAASPVSSQPSTPTTAFNALESLRSITSRDRGIHTSAAAETSVTSPTRWWFTTENKKEVDTILDEGDQADTIEGEEEHFQQKYASPKLPVVFCHGLLGFDKVSLGPVPLQISHWRGIQEVLQANGVEVLITRVPATSSPSDRAKVLAQKIEEVYPGREVHLIGHSMGGLDCRYVASQIFPRNFIVKSVTTIASPHKGSAFADHFLSLIGGTQRIPSVVAMLDMLPIGGGDGGAFKSLTLESMRKFNELVLDAPGVEYFSWGATFEPGLLDAFKYPHSVILEKEGPNDGLVSVESAKWGTYLGTLEGVNHLDLVGWINQARYKWADFMGRTIPFKPGTFYLGVCDHLARVVEGQGPAGEAPKLEHPEVQAEAGVSTEHHMPSHEVGGKQPSTTDTPTPKTSASPTPTDRRTSVDAP